MGIRDRVVVSTDARAKRWKIRMLYDGACPLCAREMRAVLRLDRGRGRIQLEDISAPDFDPGVYGLDHQTVMDRMHAVLPDGRIVEGMEAFRRACAAVGLDWLLAPTGWPGLRRIFDALYRVFARNRLRWTGRADECASGACASPTPARRSA